MIERWGEILESLYLNTYHKNSLHFAPIYDKVSVLQKNGWSSVRILSSKNI